MLTGHRVVLLLLLLIALARALARALTHALALTLTLAHCSLLIARTLLTSAYAFVQPTT